MSSVLVSIQGSMIKQFGQENPNFVQFFFHLILALLGISWKKKLRKNPILLPKLLEYSPPNSNPNRAHLFLPHKIYILTL